MKNKRIIIPLALLTIITGSCASDSHTDEPQIEKTPIETEKTVASLEQDNRLLESKKVLEKRTQIVEGLCTAPILCKGQAVLYTDDKGKLYYQKDKNTAAEVLLEKRSVGNNIAWSRDGNLVYFKEKTPDYKIAIKSININTKEIKTIEGYPPLTDLESLTISDTIYYIDSKTLAVKAKYDNKEWNISDKNKSGNYYNILTSPNNKYLAIHFNTDVLLFSTNGEFISNLGTGIATDWSPDSDYLIGFLDHSTDGHSINNSEIIKFDLTKATPEPITSTTNALEMWPTFKTKNIIVYADKLNKGLFSLEIK
ncbi:MAG: hypothetical protein N4A35_02765 [Flavobacteriales bacterium]|jgi:dipeptidyl aminopeptidase/acylaminoacyl peptidase|nr:hypothetical protein [Flavobacteriales bacterium]